MFAKPSRAYIAYRKGRQSDTSLIEECLPRRMKAAGLWTLCCPTPTESRLFASFYHGMGNIFRLLNHDCKPSASLKQKIVSSRWVVAVEARTDIFGGVDITAGYDCSHFGGSCLFASRCFAASLAPVTYPLSLSEANWNLPPSPSIDTAAHQPSHSALVGFHSAFPLQTPASHPRRKSPSDCRPPNVTLCAA